MVQAIVRQDQMMPAFLFFIEMSSKKKTLREFIKPDSWDIVW